MDQVSVTICFFLQDLEIESNESGPSIVFTPGRCGTHVLMDILDISAYMHHSDTLYTNHSQLKKLTDAKKIYSVMRYRFIDQVCSDAISNRYETINTVEKNLKHNINKIKKWESFTIQDSDIQFSLQKLITYSDLLLGLNFFYNKKIEFCVLEDLQPWFDKISHKKNPYSHRDMIANYDEIYKKTQEIYQPMYDVIIKKFRQHFGEMLHTRF